MRLKPTAIWGVSVSLVLTLADEPRTQRGNRVWSKRERRGGPSAGAASKRYGMIDEDSAQQRSVLQPDQAMSAHRDAL